MALIKCSECGRDVSTKAQNCPNCGCPVSVSVGGTASQSQPATRPPTGPQPAESRDLFRVGPSTFFVLSEIVALYEFGHRPWIGLLVAMCTAILSGLVGLLLLLSEGPTWIAAAIFAFGAFASVALLLNKDQEVATTGGSKDLGAPFGSLLKEFCARVPETRVVRYAGQNIANTMEFVINVDRVASFEATPAPQLKWFVFAGLLFASSFFDYGELRWVIAACLVLAAALFVVIGVKAIRTAITIVGVGGKNVDLFVSRKDSERIQKELRLKIGGLDR